MAQIPEFHQMLAEAVSPLSHSLAAGLLIRPVAAGPSGNADATVADWLEELCTDLKNLLRDGVPAMAEAMAALKGCAPEELEEQVDDLAAPALDFVDMARRIWETPLPTGAESARPLLATLAEAAPAQLLQWILEIMHIAIDPWAIAGNPNDPEIDFILQIPDAPLWEALVQWRADNPGILPDSFFASSREADGA